MPGRKDDERYKLKLQLPYSFDNWSSKQRISVPAALFLLNDYRKLFPVEICGGSLKLIFRLKISRNLMLVRPTLLLQIKCNNNILCSSRM